MSEVERIFVCDNVDCRLKGSLDVLERLQDRLEDEDLDIEVGAYTCFSGCQIGPNVALLPDGVWYAGVTEDDIDEIVERHIKGGDVIERLTRAVDEPTKRMIMNVLEAGGWGSVY
jgi:(2Fe-2S) ferredoxin